MPLSTVVFVSYTYLPIPLRQRNDLNRDSRKVGQQGKPKSPPPNSFRSRVKVISYSRPTSDVVAKNIRTTYATIQNMPAPATPYMTSPTRQCE